MSITGTVKFFNAGELALSACLGRQSNGGFGFIAPDGGGADAFVHISAVERAGMVTLNDNQRVGYELRQDRRGKMAAVNLQPAE